MPIAAEPFIHTASKGHSFLVKNTNALVTLFTYFGIFLTWLFCFKLCFDVVVCTSQPLS